MGKFGKPPFFYFIFEAAETLKCSVIELINHPNRSELMQMANSYQHGKTQGECNLQLNPEYQKQIKDMSKKIEAVRK